ncbi:MAG: hypothetical protein CVV44_06435 [Spirochaetae bacterium HGW-Spirochaetae-1]|jgi:AcrR family transcriptional regulator|nr:MAG: hypothetical protein CVV44_06435 [Spirochaetae bacterium HGW-Spirochaetae-1]
MGPRDRKLRELEDRKKYILEKSRELFFRKGYEQVTIQDICDAVEYGRSVIYSMFESKEEIYSYIYLDALEILITLNSSIDPHSDDFDAQFMRGAENLYRFYADYTDYYKALSYFNNNSMAYSKIPPALLERKKFLGEKAGEPFAVLLERFMQKDLLRRVNIPDFINLFFSAVIGVIGLFIHTEEEEDKERIRSFVMLHAELYREGLKK